MIQALLSVMTDQGDVIHSIAVGSSSIEFLLRGQLYLVGVSSRSEAQLSLRRQLELLYQSILMVATGGAFVGGCVYVCVGVCRCDIYVTGMASLYVRAGIRQSECAYTLSGSCQTI